MDLLEKFRREGKVRENDKVTCILVETEEDLAAVLELLDIWEVREENSMIIDMSPYTEYIKLLYLLHEKYNKKIE